jgi:hypothetical protein
MMRRQNILERDLEPAPRTAADWNGVALRAIGTGGTAPADAAHALAILHTCMYNAWAAYDDNARQTPHGFAVRLPRAERSAANKACAMSHAARLALTARFPAQRAAIDAECARLGLDPGPAGLLSPAGIGRVQATCMLDACVARDERAGAAAGAPPFAVAHHGIQRAGDGAGWAPADWCRRAHDIPACAGYDDDRDVLLYFVLANALADGAAAAGVQRAGAAAAEALRCFTGAARWQDGAGADDWGTKIGALVFDRARRYWQGLP